jgi:hypothetical protein
MPARADRHVRPRNRTAFARVAAGRAHPRLVMRVPESLQSRPSRTVAVVAVDNASEVVHAYSGEIDGFPMLIGVRERDGVSFGSLPGGEQNRHHAGCFKLDTFSPSR